MNRTLTYATVLALALTTVARAAIIVDNGSGDLTYTNEVLDVNSGSDGVPSIHVIDGRTLTITGTADITDTNNAGTDIGIQLGTAGTATGHYVQTGGSFAAFDTTTTSGTHMYGLVAYQNSTFNISAGDYSVTEAGNGHAYAFRLFENSSGTVSGTANITVDETLNQNASAFDLSDSSSLNITGGTVTVNSTDGQPGFVLIARGDTTANISGGTFDIESTLTVRLFEVNDNASVTVTGGSYVTNEPSNELQLVLMNGAGSELTVSGGSFSTTAVLTIDFHTNAGPDSLVTIIANNFMIDGFAVAPGLVTADTGTLTGTFADDNDFEFAFDQNNVVSRILLVSAGGEPNAVPAPAALPAALAMLTAIGAGRRRCGGR